MTWFLLAEPERGKTLPPTSSAELRHSFRTSKCSLDAFLWISRGCMHNFLPRLHSACLSLVVLWDPCPVLISWNWHTVILQYARIFAQREVYCVSMPTNSKNQPIFLPSLPLFFPSLPSIFLSLSSNTQFMHLSNGWFPVGQHSVAKRTQEEGGLQGGLYASSLSLLSHHSVSGSVFPYIFPKIIFWSLIVPRHGIHSDKDIERAFRLFVSVRESSRGREERGKGVGLGRTKLSGVITSRSALMGCNHLKDIGISFLHFLLLLQHLLLLFYWVLSSRLWVY